MKVMEMCRLYEKDYPYAACKEIWIRKGTFNIERKRWGKKGYDLVHTIVTRKEK